MRSRQILFTHADKLVDDFSCCNSRHNIVDMYMSMAAEAEYDVFIDH